MFHISNSKPDQMSQKSVMYCCCFTWASLCMNTSNLLSSPTFSLRSYRRFTGPKLSPALALKGEDAVKFSPKFTLCTFLVKTKAGSKHFKTGYVFASKLFSKCDKCCHLMDRCRVWFSSAVGRKRDHGDDSLLPFHTLLRGEATAWPERCFCRIDSPGTCSFGSESRSLATHPQLGGGEGYARSGYLTISRARGGKNDFSLEKTHMVNTGHGMVLYCQTVKAQHSGVKHMSKRLWDLEFSKGRQKSSDSWRQ